MASASAAPSASATTSNAADAGAMPERPVPKTSPTVGAAMPPEVQMKAIAYMASMRAPREGDAPADASYAEEIKKKLGPIAMSLDSNKGAGTNRVEVVAGGRQIDLLMGGGCDDQAPKRAVVQRAGVTFATLLSRGILVVRCNDAHVQCLQSTRDATDVLCTTAPRHK
jgi:hypothetical protein